MSEKCCIKAGGGMIALNKTTLEIEIGNGANVWRTDPAHPPRVETADGDVRFSAARHIEHSEWKTGVGAGVRSAYRRIPGLGGMEFDTIIWREASTGQFVFEFIPMREAVNTAIKAVWFPAPFVLDGASSYSALTYMQGCILPNDWPKDFPELKFGGQMCSQSAYMPWWGQVRATGAGGANAAGASAAGDNIRTNTGESGYIAIVEQPWDAKYAVRHAAGGPTSIGVGLMPSLGAMRYRRTLRVAVLGGCDHNDLCAVYRQYADERGLLITLKEKAARAPHINKLIGAAVVHLGIKSHVSPGSRYYHKDEPEKNDRLTPFSKRTEQMKAIAGMGIKKAYLHLDGWGQPGYDNRHPDYLPACEEAGGWDGLRELCDTCRDKGFLFGLHDQYRDYFLDAATYDPEMAVHLADGTLYGHAIWAGGAQNYLCSSQAPMYVKRNFEEVFANGVRPDAAYLDVFTCNEPDECSHPLHAVTRKECLEYRKQCFDYLYTKGILPSSEEVIDWAMQSLVFCHWAPYGDAAAGIPAPLLNLVYHDCVVVPWMLGRGKWGTPGNEPGFLHALLNGGIGYLDPELPESELKENLAQIKTVSELSERVGMLQMTKHEFLTADRRVQRTTFADGTTVTVYFENETYNIEF